LEYDYSGLHIHILYSKIGRTYSGKPYDLSLPGFDPSTLRGVLKKILLIFINSNNWKSAQQAINQEIKRDKSITGDLNITELYEKFLDLHSDISEFFFSGIGVKLQYTDSIIAESIMKCCLKRCWPILPMHDGFICQSSYRGFIEDIMKSSYMAITKAEPQEITLEELVVESETFTGNDDIVELFKHKQSRDIINRKLFLERKREWTIEKIDTLKIEFKAKHHRELARLPEPSNMDIYGD